MNEKEVYTPQEIAKKLSISAKTVHRMLDAGELPVIHLGRLKRVPRERFDDWLTTQKKNADGYQVQRRVVPLCKVT